MGYCKKLQSFTLQRSCCYDEPALAKTSFDLKDCWPVGVGFVEVLLYSWKDLLRPECVDIS